MSTDTIRGSSRRKDILMHSVMAQARTSPAALANANKRKHPKAVPHTSNQTIPRPMPTSTKLTLRCQIKQEAEMLDLLLLRVSSRRSWSEPCLR
jgi:hypothetical protein